MHVHIKTFILLVVLVASLSFWTFVAKSQDFSSGGGSFGGGGSSASFGTSKAPPFIPFGGRILTVTTCDSGLLLTIGPPRGGVFFFQYGLSLLYAWYQIYRPGPWTLGRAYPTVGVCYVPCQNGRCPAGAGPIIEKVGTSLK